MDYLYLVLFFVILFLVMSLVFKILVWLWPLWLALTVILIIYRIYLSYKLSKVINETYEEESYRPTSSQDVIDADIEIITEEETDE